MAAAAATWKIRARLPAGMAVVETTSDTPFAVFKEALWAAANLDFEEEPKILAGFPPRPLELSDDAAIGGTLANNETVTIQASSGGNPEGKGKARRGRNAPKQPKSPKVGIFTLAGGSRGGGGGSSGGGGGSSGKKRARADDGMGSTHDITDSLLAAVSGGKGKKNKALRGVFQEHVNTRWEETKANDRLRAALGGRFTFEEMTSERSLGDGAATKTRVTFAKGEGERSKHVDEVDALPEVLVQQVVLHVLQSGDVEMLKPFNMAYYAPRVFWCVVRLRGGDVSQALRQLVPTLPSGAPVDWSFLEVRERPMSAKAKAHLEEKALRRQMREERKKERELLGKTGPDSEEDIYGSSADEGEEMEVDPVPAASKASKAASKASKAQKTAVAGAAAAAAAAAAGGSSSGSGQDDSAPVLEAEAAAAAAVAAPGGLAAAAAAARAAAAEARAAAAASPAAAAAAPIAAAAAAASAVVIDAKAEAENAAVAALKAAEPSPTEEDEEELKELLGEEAAAAAAALLAAGVKSMRQLAHAEVAAVAAAAGVEEEKASEWLSAAQGEVLDDIMAEILDMDIDVKDALDEYAKTSTPRDLLESGRVPDMLVKTLFEAMGEEKAAPLRDTGKITPAKVAKWHKAAQARLRAFPWLVGWVTE